jgi:pyridoxal 5'-phosphate synthase pdxT subunit
VDGKPPRVGVLAVQGDFREHAEMLRSLGAEAIEVRRPGDLEGLDGIVIPGGESTTIRMLMADFGLTEPVHACIESGTPVLGTCAGMIVLARSVDGIPSPGLDALDVDVRRNAFGRQVDSFEADLPVDGLGDGEFHAVFIRAPVVQQAGPGVEILARLEDGRIVAVRQGSVLGIAFHPELTQDTRFHQMLLDLIATREPVSSRRG